LIVYFSCKQIDFFFWSSHILNVEKWGVRSSNLTFAYIIHCPYQTHGNYKQIDCWWPYCNIYTLQSYIL